MVTLRHDELGPYDVQTLDSAAAALAAADDGRVHLICIRPAGTFRAFDQRLTSLAERLVRVMRVTILRTWDFAANQDWVGFVSAAVPTVLLVRAGQVVAKFVGDLPTREVEDMVLAAAH